MSGASGSRWLRRSALAIVVLMGWASQRDARAYVFYTAGETGEPLRWFQTEVSYRLSTVEAEEIPAEELEALVQQGFDAWLDAPGCKVPDIRFAGSIDWPSRTTPVDLCEPSDNVVVFVRSRSDWAREGHSATFIAVTTIAHDTVTGEIVDADIEINDAGFRFSTSSDPPEGSVDFASMIAHEVGHFLGMEHSADPQATMFETYNRNRADPLHARTLAADDVDGICALYDQVPDISTSRCLEGEGGNGEGGGCSSGPAPPSLLYLVLLVGFQLVRVRPTEKAKLLGENGRRRSRGRERNNA